MSLLPSNGGTGSLGADFNRDGYLDLLLISHRSEGDPEQIGKFGDHVTHSFIYWGSPQGFDPHRRLAVLTEGAHQDWGVELGNIYDRKFRFDYISSPYDSASATPARIEWNGETPHGSRLKFQIRRSETLQGLEEAKWVGPKGIDSFFESSGSSVDQVPAGWIQYRSIFLSTDGINYPILEEVSIDFH